MSNWKGTKEKELIVIPHTIYPLYRLVQDDAYRIVHITTIEEASANAALFTDALHTIQQCDLMPSQLLKELDDLKNWADSEIEKHIKEHEKDHQIRVNDANDYIVIANALKKERDENAKLKGFIKKVAEFDIGRFGNHIPLIEEAKQLLSP